MIVFVDFNFAQISAFDNAITINRKCLIRFCLFLVLWGIDLVA
jgi:hypothetical protein